MRVTIQGVTGYLIKMRASYSYSEYPDGKINNIHAISYTVTLLQEDGTEIKFTGVAPADIKIEAVEQNGAAT